MSNSTIVSLYPSPIGPEFKPGLNPNDFVIPAATEETLGILVIPDGWTDIPMLDYKTLRVAVPSAEIARSVVEDWKSAQLCVNGVDAAPGLFYVDGPHSEDSILDNFDSLISHARNMHTGWAQALVRMADDLWEIKPVRRQISKSMVNAAKYLKLDRAWTKNARPEDTVRCPSCTSLVPAESVVCQYCKVVLDAEAYSRLTFARG